MLKALQILVLFLAVAFFLALAGLAYYSSPPPTYPSEQQTAAQATEKQPHEKQHTFSGLINFLFPDAISIFTFWLVVATIVLGVIAYVQIDFLRRAEWISAKIAQAAKDSAYISKQTLIVAQRAWIRIDQIGPGGGGLAIDKNGANMSVSFKITNIGNSPPINVNTHAWLIVLKSGGAFPLEEQKRRCSEIRNQPVASGFTLFPGESFPSNIGINSYSFGTNASREEIEKGAATSSDEKQIMLYVVGCIDYTFPTDATKHHQTGFVLEVMRDRILPTITLDDGIIPISRLSLIEGMAGVGKYAD